MKKRTIKPASQPLPASKRGTASLAHRAYVEIRDKILKGDLPVGVALSRRKLAEELKVSVPPITEALQHLERDGLVESKPRVGTRVRIPMAGRKRSLNVATAGGVVLYELFRKSRANNPRV